MNKQKNCWLITLILCFFLGTLGIHRLYNKKIWTGILQLLTFGGFGIWALIDLILILSNKFKIKEKEQTNSEEENIEPSKKDWLITFSLCWTLGFVGAHRFYNKKIGTGILQLLTFGGLGIWTFIDLINISRHKFLDKNNNTVIARKRVNYKVAISIFTIVLIIINSYNAVILINSIEKAEKLQEEIDTDLILDVIKMGYSKIVLVQVFMDYDATEEQISKLQNDLSQIKGVYNLTYVSKKDAHNTMKESTKNNEKALKAINEMDPDLYPVSFKLETVEKNLNTIYNLPGVREIATNTEIRDTIRNHPIMVSLMLFVIYYKEMVILSMIILVIRMAISIGIIYSVYKNKNELTLAE